MARESLIRQFSRFTLVGGVATAVQYGGLVLLAELAGLSAVRASTIAFFCSAMTNYALNRRFTFDADLPHATSLPRFAMVVAGGLVLNAIVMAAGTGPLGLHYALAQLLASAVVFAWNFVCHRHWTFAAAAR